MKKKTLVILLAFALVLTSLFAAFAAVNTDPTKDMAYFSDGAVSVITEYDSNKMPYFFGNDIDATLNMDTTAVFFGRRVTVKGNYENDVIVFGDAVTIDANVKGNLYVFSSTATQSGTVGGDMFNFSSNFQQLSTAAVTGNLYAFCASPMLQGEVMKNAYLFCDSAVLFGKVGGNVQGGVDQLRVEDKATVGGFIKYQSENDPVLIGSAQSIPFERIPFVKSQEKTFMQEALSAALKALGFAAALLLVYLFLARLTPKAAENLKRNLKHRAAAAFGLGCAVFFGMPIVAGLMMFISVQLGFALLALYAFLLLIAMFAALAALFDLITAKKSNMAFGIKLLFVALLGFVVKLLLAVPVVGVIIGVAGLIFGAGLIISLLLRPVKQKENLELEA